MQAVRRLQRPGPSACCCVTVVILQPERLYGLSRTVATIAVGGVGSSRTNGFRPRRFDHMDRERTPATERWSLRANIELDRVMAAERRLALSISANNDIARVAAADELQVATRDATTWVTANPCPDAEIAGDVASMLSSCAEVALMAQRARL